MADNKKEQERAELHRAIWNIASDLRGSIDGWDFKQYVLGMLFYRYISENLTNYINQSERESGNKDFNYADLEKVARGFKLIQYGSETMTVEGMWAGTIFAPNADLVLGQSSKKLYGRFLGKNVTVHQYTQVYGIPFAPEMNTAIARRK